MKKCYLSKGKEVSALRGHLWIFSGAIARFSEQPEEGEWVEIVDSAGKYVATGYVSNESSIAVRICGREAGKSPGELIREKLASAISARVAAGFPSEETNLFRLVHGEGDGLPGLIVDVYGSTAVMQCHTAGMYLMRKDLAEILTSDERMPIKSVFDKSTETLKSNSIRPGENGYLTGTGKDEEFRETGLKFSVDWVKGQKTGFFIDQRESRKLIAKYARDKKVLNTFCYSGGFSVYALAGGASEVHSLDSSAHALELTEKNVELNPHSGIHKTIKADAVEHIKMIDSDYDLIVLDPPAFAKNIRARHNALQAYKRLNRAAMERIKPGGTIFTFSCSQTVDKEMFKGAIMAAGIEAGRQVRILHQLHQPEDHPVNLFHPESEYLKGLVLMVD
jgi:23S rRNA (cytosine1962-C5)-methyltransferase